MGTKDRRVDAYIAKSADFAKPILSHLRRVVHNACPEVEEAMKWSFPHFMYKGILCSMAAFNEHCAFGFWKGDLVFAQMPRSQVSEQAMGQFGRIKSLSDLPSEKNLAACVRAAVALADAGVKNPSRSGPRRKKELQVPDELISALKKNKAASKTFDGFTYSHKKEYVEWITEAKREETRQKRLATALEWLAQGKPRNWKYMGC